MGRLVKIWDMGTKGDSNDAYRAPNGKYYSTKAAYDEIEKEKENRKKCIDEIMFLLGYEPNMKPNTYIFKLLRELESYGYDVIYETIMKTSKDITWAFTRKSFSSEINQIKYMFAIINNNILYVYKNKQNEKAQKMKSSNIIEIGDYLSSKQKTKDISRWLDDEERD